MVDLTALRSARPDLLDQAAGAWSRLGNDFGKQAAALRGDVVARQQSAGRAGVPPVRATTSAHAVAATIMGRTRPRRVRWAHGHPSVDGANGPAARERSDRLAAAPAARLIKASLT